MLTLTVSEILTDVISAFKSRVPAINRMGRDFQPRALKLNKQYIAHIAGVPGVSDYDEENGGYEANATDARSLLTDVPITVDMHKKVSLSFAHLNAIADQKMEYEKVIGNTGYALARHMVGTIIEKCNSRNLSRSSVYSEANSDYDALDAIRNGMNSVEAAESGRTGIVNTAVASAMHLDQRILNRQWRPSESEQGASAYRVFRDIAGFDEVFEWPGLPTNDGTVTALDSVANATDTFTKAAHGLEDGDRVEFSGTALPTGLTAETGYYVRDADTNTFKVSETVDGAAVNITSDGTAVSFQRKEYLTGVFFEPRALGVLAGVPEDVTKIADALGIPQVQAIEVVTDPDTGLSMMAISAQKQGTLNTYMHITMLWGSSVGKQGGAAGSLTDYAGHRLTKV